MTVDKSLRQHYKNIGFSKVKPSKNGLRPGYAFAGTGGSTGSSGGTGGGGAAQRAREQADAQAAARQGQAAAARRSMQATIAAAEKAAVQKAAPVTTGGGMIAGPVQGLISQPKAPVTYTDPDPVTEIVPGDETFKPVEKYIAPIVHPEFDTKETLAAQKTLDIQQMIAKQQEEKYGLTADPTKFGETVAPRDKRTQKEKDEDLERSIDWDKVKDLSKKGYDFKEIQSAMDKGLLTKADPQSIKTNLLDRGIRRLRNIIPETRLEKSLLGGLKKSFAPTTGGMFDPKKMAFGALKNVALKKMGLGWLNPYLGIASLLGFDLGSLTSKFAKKPAFDIEAASKLGLQANRFPGQLPTKEQYTDDTLTAKARDAYDLTSQVAGEENIIAKNIAKFTGKPTYPGRNIDPYEDEDTPGLKGLTMANLIGTTPDVTDTDNLYADISFPKGKFSWDTPGTYTYDTMQGQTYSTMPDVFKENLDKQFEKEGITTQAQKKEFFDKFEDTIADRATKSGGISATTITTPEIMANTDIIPDTRSWIQKNIFNTGEFAEGGRIDKPLTGRSRDI